MLPLRIAHACAHSSLSNLPSFCQASLSSPHTIVGQVLLNIGHHPHCGNFFVVIIGNPSIQKDLLQPYLNGSIRMTHTDKSCHCMVPPGLKSTLFFVGLIWVGPPYCRAHSHSHHPAQRAPLWWHALINLVITWHLHDYFHNKAAIAKHTHHVTSHFFHVHLAFSNPSNLCIYFHLEAGSGLLCHYSYSARLNWGGLLSHHLSSCLH